MKKVILVVDDEKNARDNLREIIEDIMGLSMVEADCAKTAIELIRNRAFDLILTDLRMPGESGMLVLEEAQKICPETPVIIMTAFGSADEAGEALKKGAYDFLSKPLRAGTVEEKIAETLRLDEKQEAPDAFDKIIGSSDALKETIKTARQAAPTDATILIEGESGTGKGLLAECIHEASPRRKGKFVVIHCANTPQDILMSELFGHEKGSFTGAISQHKGKFEEAGDGTVFIDEVGTLPLKVQTILLRVLQDKKFERLGGNETIISKARVIAATNENLSELVKAGRFREDLLYRLKVVSLTMPPLRVRKGDIPLLIDHFLAQANKETSKSVTISKIAREMMEKYSWSGNIRELHNCIEALVIKNSSGEVTPRDLPIEILTENGAKKEEKSSAALWEKLDKMTLDEIKKELIERKLKKGKTRTQIADELGISRRSLYRLPESYGIKKGKKKDE